MVGCLGMSGDILCVEAMDKVETARLCLCGVSALS